MKAFFASLLLLLPAFSIAQCDGVRIEEIPAESCQGHELSPRIILPTHFPKKVQIQWAVSGGESVDIRQADQAQAFIRPTSLVGQMTITVAVTHEACPGKANTPNGPQIITRTLDILPNPEISPLRLSSCQVEACGHFNLYEAFPASVRGKIVGFWKDDHAAEQNIASQKIKTAGNYAAGKTEELFARISGTPACSQVVTFKVEVIRPPAGLEDEIDQSLLKKMESAELAQHLGLGKVTFSLHRSFGDAWNPKRSNTLDSPDGARYLRIEDPQTQCASVLRINNSQ